MLGINSPAVTIKNIENSIIDYGFQQGWVKALPPAVRTGKKVAVVGSGPAGLAAAAQLNKVRVWRVCWGIWVLLEQDLESVLGDLGFVGAGLGECVGGFGFCWCRTWRVCWGIWVLLVQDLSRVCWGILVLLCVGGFGFCCVLGDLGFVVCWGIWVLLMQDLESVLGDFGFVVCWGIPDLLCVGGFEFCCVLGDLGFVDAGFG